MNEVEPLCWWCEAKADSSEHKFKRTDITRIFGDGPYLGGRTLHRLSEERTTALRGPKSAVLKFSPTMCRRCNNVRSQPFDHAYDRFIRHVDSQADSILQRREISLRAVFGPTLDEERRNLVCYFVKHICCRLAEPQNTVRFDVHPELITFLDGGQAPNCLELDIYIDELSLRMWRIFKLADDPTNIPPAFVALSPLFGELDVQGGAARNPQSAIGYGWLWVAWRISDGAGFINPFSGDVVHLRRAGHIPWPLRARLALGEARARVERFLGIRENQSDG